MRRSRVASDRLLAPSVKRRIVHEAEIIAENLEQPPSASRVILAICRLSPWPMSPASHAGDIAYALREPRADSICNTMVEAMSRRARCLSRSGPVPFTDVGLGGGDLPGVAPDP